MAQGLLGVLPDVQSSQTSVSTASTWGLRTCADIDSVGLGWGPRSCISDQLLGEASAAAQETTLEYQGAGDQVIVLISEGLKQDPLATLI